jgi:hypothetical protein
LKVEGMNIKVSEVIDRSPEVVFQFVGVEHIRNHPRWDTKMELEQLSDGPMAVGTRCVGDTLGRAT